jgi:2-polyprenyl-6-methoxyphenol hydroxylase-like FAD-dependent oxidoreductase
MVGVLPIGRLKEGAGKQAAFFWSLKHADVASWRNRTLDAWKADVLKLWPETAPLLDQIKAREQLIFAAYAHGTLRSPLWRHVVHLGDSWHSASPQLGQGANMALLDALALSRALAVHRDIPMALGAYARARLMHIRIYQLASWMFTPAYQSDGRAIVWLRDWLLGPISRVWPAPALLAALVAGNIAAPLAAIDAVGDG